MDGDILFDRASSVLVVGKAGFGVGDSVTRRLETRVECLFTFWRLGEPTLGFVPGGIELLQRDHALEVGVHQKGIFILHRSRQTMCEAISRLGLPG